MATATVFDPTLLSIEDLEDELATLASHIYAGTCRWLELVGELDRRGDWAESGCGSCAEWLAWRCALLPRAAREHVRVARRLPELPLVRAAFARGELSYAKVRALTRVADADSEQELLELARVMTAAQLERAVSAYRRVTTADANDLHEDSQLTTFWDADGSLVIRGRLAPEEGALFLRALESARDSLWKHARGSADPRRGSTGVEALAALADAALASTDGRSGGERYQVVLHVDAETLPKGDEGGCALDDGPAIAPETARRLACDASLVAISERNGKTVRVGRKTRSIPPALRRALTARDSGCRFPGCENHRFVDAHHVQHWARGGETRLENLVLLCRRHHRLVHEGGYGIDDRLRFYDPWGRRIPRVWRAPPGDAGALMRQGETGVIGPNTCESGTGERMDVDLAVDALLSATCVGPWPTRSSRVTHWPSRHAQPAARRPPDGSVVLDEAVGAGVQGAPLQARLDLTYLNDQKIEQVNFTTVETSRLSPSVSRFSR